MSITNPDDVPGSFDVRTGLLILQRNLRLIILCSLIAVFSALLFLAFTSPRYTASVMILIDPRQEQILEAEKAISANPGLESPVVDSEVELVRSVAVVHRVIDRLNLKTDPEFVGRESVIAQVRSAISSFISSPDETGPDSSADPELLQATNTMMKNLSVKRRGLTYVIDIAFTSEDSSKAALIANEIAKAYLDDQLDAKYVSTKRATQWLSNRLDVLKNDVQKAEYEVGEFAAQNNLLTISGEENPFDKQLEEINNQLIAARAEVVERKLQLNRRSPSSELQKDYDLAVSRKQTLEEEFVELADAANDRERSAIRLRELERDAVTSRDLYESFLTRYKEATEQQSLQSPDSRIVSEALVPSHPSYPRKSWVLLIALFVGAGGGVTLSLVREHLDDSIRTPDDIPQKSGYGCLAMVPDVPQVIINQFSSGGTNSLVDSRFSGFTQSIRNILFNLDMQSVFGRENVQNVLVVTSCDPDDGKTTLALAIANYAALHGARTLLIDVDVQAASASKRLGLENDDGLVQLLKSRDLEIGAYLKQISNEQSLFALPVGQETFDAQELIASERMEHLIGRLKREFKIIIIDCPPVADGLETISLAKLSDRMVFITRWGNTSASFATTIINTIRQKSAVPIGVVLNRVNFKRLRTYTEYSSRFY